MLSGEGNENAEKTTIGLISKKSNFARAAHLFCKFLCRCFARLQRETSTNFFLLALVAASISHFVTAAAKFSCCSSHKKYLLCVLSLALDICRPFSR